MKCTDYENTLPDNGEIELLSLSRILGKPLKFACKNYF